MHSRDFRIVTVADLTLPGVIRRETRTAHELKERFGSADWRPWQLSSLHGVNLWNRHEGDIFRRVTFSHSVRLPPTVSSLNCRGACTCVSVPISPG